ncbi:calcium-binding protein [Shinella pollutisoli]|uniref:Calcium-binding protein n=1 Tax=Shinella pollutisoli TaxID=2250594 RepID=A0ABV7DIF5_9HYPH|nr:calcium-binding protein [Shinella pollutisoli]
MAITITAYDANKDGKGIDFAAYLKAFTSFDASGYGGFNGTDPFSGTQYASTNDKEYGALLTSGVRKWVYDFPTHTVTGSISKVEFGNKIKLNAKNNYDITPDLRIAGLNVTDKELAGDLLSEVSNGNTSGIMKIVAANAVSFVGSTGADVFTGFGKADKLSGGNGNDTLRGAGGNDAIYGGNGNDKLYGDAGSDGIKGGAGNDAIYGGDGNDRLYGEAGSDGIKGGNGNDKIYGGAGNDRLYGEAGADGIKGGSGNDKIYGGTGSDRLYGETGNDSIKGGTGNDLIYGNSGADKLYGEAGNDKLYGNSGNDTLSGGAGNDRLEGGTGNDTLYGGAGADTFVFRKNEGRDTIKDFQAGSGKGDVIHLDDAVLKNYADVLDHAQDTATGVLIEYGKGSILLSGVEKFDLHANDFFFF